MKRRYYFYRSHQRTALLTYSPLHRKRMSKQNTARSGTGTARSRKSGLGTARSRKSQSQETIEELPPPPKALDKFEPWTKYLKTTEKSILLIKPDVVEEHEDDIIQYVEDFAEMRGFEILECSRIQLVKEKAMSYCLATQESRSVEDERLAEEEAERVRIEEETQRIEIERVTAERRADRQARRDAGDSDVEEDTVYGGNTTRRSTARTQQTGRSKMGTARTKGTARTGKTGRSTARSNKSGSKTSRQRQEEAAEQQRLLEEEEEKKLVQRERIASFLCGGEVIVMICEGKECVEGLLELVGDDDPEYWPDFPDSLRSKYGTDVLRNAVECSLIPIAGHREVEFFKSLLEERAMMDALLKSGRSKPAKKSHWVSMENLLSFCFPDADRHPLSTGRLSVFGNYGPLAVSTVQK